MICSGAWGMVKLSSSARLLHEVGSGLGQEPTGSAHSLALARGGQGPVVVNRWGVLSMDRCGWRKHSIVLVTSARWARRCYGSENLTGNQRFGGSIFSTYTRWPRWICDGILGSSRWWLGWDSLDLILAQNTYDIKADLRLWQ